MERTHRDLSDYPTVEYRLSLQETDSLARWRVPYDIRKSPSITAYLPAIAEHLGSDTELLIETHLMIHFILERVCMGRYFERTRKRRRCGQYCPPYQVANIMAAHTLGVRQTGIKKV
jgi:hypothetical protein